MTGPSMRVEVTRATLKQKPILENLLELYADDFRAFHAIELRPDGRFVYPTLSLYWQEEGRHPFLIHIDGAPGGVRLGTERLAHFGGRFRLGHGGVFHTS